jgi:hypothetical protein
MEKNIPFDGWKHVNKNSFFVANKSIVKDLEDFKASHKAPFGTIISEWKRVGGTVNYKVVVPLNSIAELRFDDSVKQVTKKGKMDVLDLSMPVKLEAGVYEFVVE